MAAAANVVGDMVLYVHKAQHLRDTEVFGKQDPYVKLSLGPANMQAKRTAVKDDAGTSAVWEEKFNFHLVGVESTLDLHVLNKEVVTDETIGRCSIPLEKLLESDKPMWYTLDKNYGYILMTCKFKGTLKGNPVNTLEHIDAKQEQPAPPAKPAEVAAPNPFHVVPTAEAKTSVVAELKLAEVCNPKQAVANAYMAIIGRKAPDNFVNVYSDRLSSGKAALPGLVVSLLESDEFAARGLGTLHSLPVRSLIGFTFEALTGNSPTRSAYEECTAKLAQMPREEFVFWVASRQEAKDRLSNPKLAAVPFHRRRTPIIARFYSTVLGRDIDNWGVSTYVTGVNNYKYSVSDVFQLLLDSEEFGTKGKGNFNTIANDEFVRVMVRAFFERDDEAGTAFHAARLNNNSISKSQLLDEFASCPEFLEKVAADYVEPVSHDFKSPEPTHPENSVASAYIAVRRTEPNLEFVQFHAHRLKTKQCQFADVVIALLNEERKGGLGEYEPLNFVGRVFEAVTGTMLTHAGKSNWTLLELEKHETREDFVRYAASTPLSHLRHTTFGHMMYYNFGDMLVKQFFRAYLGRDVNGEAVGHHTAFLNRYEWTPADMVVHFMNCPEFAAKGKGDFNSCNSHEFVSMLVHAFFSRNPSEGDIKYHADRLDAGQITRLQLADEFTTSEEMFIHRHKVLTGLVTPMVERFYRVFMGREPDAGGLEHYVERICLRKLTITTVIELMLDSPEFQAKGKGHFLTVDSRELVKMLTASLFNHEADDAGIQYHSKRVDSHAISRHDLVLEFCHCPEFRDHYPGL